MRNIVNGLLIRDDMLLMARRSAHRKTYPSLWSFPGGHVEPDETLAEGLRRELTEKIGIIPVDFRLIGSIADPNTSSVTYHMHLVTSWRGGKPRLMDDEHTELRWVTKKAASALRQLALEEYRHLIAGLPFPPE